jgi:hypothetical protein
MSQVETSQGAIEQRKSPSGTSLSVRETTLLVLGSVLLIIVFWIAAFLVIFSGIALAQDHAASNTAPRVTALSVSLAGEAAPAAFDPAALPSLGSINAQTDIAVFLRSGVPDELQVAALRRAWTVDPAIRDFKGLNENDWDFTGPNSAPGFGELGPEVDIDRMVAQIFGDPPRLTLAGSALPPWRHRD